MSAALCNLQYEIWRSQHLQPAEATALTCGPAEPAETALFVLLDGLPHMCGGGGEGLHLRAVICRAC